MSELMVYFWDVRHGHATYLRTPNGRHMVFDLGIGDYSLGSEDFSPLQFIQYEFGVKQLDVVCISHPHLDHIDDVLNLSDLSPIVLVKPPGILEDNVMKGVRQQDFAKFREYFDLSRSYCGAVPTESDIHNPNNWGGMTLQIFSPSMEYDGNLNNASLVVVVSYLGCKVVIPGDNEFKSLQNLLEDRNFCDAVRDADVLLAPHHGRQSALHLEFVKLVSPKLTIVSDGSVCDTSANSRYSALSSGWSVVSRETGLSEMRRCLTTNSDGHIEVRISPGPDVTYLEVTRE